MPCYSNLLFNLIWPQMLEFIQNESFIRSNVYGKRALEACIPQYMYVLCIRALMKIGMLVVRWCSIICFLFTPLKPLPYYILCYLNDTNIHFQETSFKERQKYVIQVDASFAVQKTNILLTYIYMVYFPWNL